MYRVIVCGTRSAGDYRAFEKTLLAILARANTSDVEIVHGGCPTGADAMAHEFCVAHKIPERVYPADWTKHGRAAGPIRNEAMATCGADLCASWWDGASKGTAGMIKLACENGIRVLINPVGKNERS